MGGSDQIQLASAPVTRASDGEQVVAASRRAHYFLNGAIATLWLGYAWGTFELWRQSPSSVHLALLIRNTTITVLFLCRRPATLTSRSWTEWIVSVGSTFLGFLFGEGRSLLPSMAFPLMVVSAVLMTVCLLTLGRSFGIVPANRGIQVRGPYRVVRHPMYSCYVLFDFGVLLVAFSMRNLMVLVGMILSLYLRARYEERMLRLDPEYQAYAERTRYMFVRGVL